MYKVEALPLGGQRSNTRFITVERIGGEKKASLTGIRKTLNGHNSKSLVNSVIISLGRLHFTYEVARE